MRMTLLLAAFTTLLLGGCTQAPKGVTPITNFQTQQYLGTWYEIARLDHSFERGLSHVTANYSPRDDGGIKVINRGYDAQKQRWKEAEGKAYLLDKANVGSLKVSFFGPFYGGYHIMALDKEYQYALISGPDLDYLWILSRTPTLSQPTLNMLIKTAQQAGFNTQKLIFPIQQNRPQETPSA
ncbi:MAG: lipocalin family protein [Plesiomonas sp.]|uniref:lipocalin family protein n=1 Tax=Plesiomonas sp. TaxID=2486279 RepID=UPI003F3BE812